MDKTPKSKLHPRNYSPVLVLAAALLITTLATVYAFLSVQGKDSERFQNAVQTSADTVRNRLQTYVALLRGTRGLFSASDTVSADDFRAYVDSLEIDRYFPGVQGIGYSRRVTREGAIPEKHRIEFLEPQNPRNLAAYGRDMFRDEVRREAMERARDTGDAALSGRVTLFQEIEPLKQAGFLIYLPIYRQGASTKTVAERRDALLGFVYSPFRADDFFQTITNPAPSPRLTLDVFDGQGFVPAQQLHRSDQSEASDSGAPRFQEVRVLNNIGRDWTVRFGNSIHFERTSSIAFVPLVAVGGLLISFLLYALFVAQARGRDEAERISREVQRSEEALRQANQAKDEFLAMLGHELRNPLGAISNALQVMTERTVTDPHLLRARDVVERQVRHQTRLIEDLLDVSRVYSGKISLRKEPVDLNSTARNAAEGLKWAVKEQGHALQTLLSETPVIVHGDPVRLEQIATNLIHNAIKYTPPGGLIEISVGRAGTDAVLRVKDTGVGISAEMLGRIFDVFTQAQISIDRSQGGLGLGLTLVRNLTQMHGGRVHAQSLGVGQGSEFVVQLPLSHMDQLTSISVSAIVTDPPAPAAPARADVSIRLRVLIVEDLRDARETLQELLELHGHEVQTANDGEAGLAALLLYEPDLALIDIGLPVLDGYQVAARFRAEKPETAVRLIALTGYGQPEDRERAREAGFDEHIVKPIDPEQLSRVFQNDPQD